MELNICKEKQIYPLSKIKRNHGGVKLNALIKRKSQDNLGIDGVPDKRKIKPYSSGAFKSGKFSKENISILTKNFLGIIFYVKKFSSKLKHRLVGKWLDKLSDYKIDLYNDSTFFKEAAKAIQEKKKINLSFNQKVVLPKCLDFTFTKIETIFILCRSLISKINIFEPFDALIVYWNILLLLFLASNVYYNLIEISFAISDSLSNYEDDSLRFLFYHLPTWLLILNIFISLNTSFYKKGQYIQKRKKIFKRYFKSSFFIDLISLIPYFILLAHSSNFFVRLLYMFRFLKFRSLFKYFEDHLNLRGKTKGIFQLCKLMITLFYSAHIIACLWVFVGILQEECFKEESWITLAGVNLKDKGGIYITSLYYSTVTMLTVGYGEIHPNNNLEKIISVVTIFLSCGIFGYSINSIGTILEGMNKSEREFRSSLADIDYLLKQKNISKALQVKIKSYLEYMHEEKDKNLDEVNNAIQKMLSESLNSEYNIDYYGTFLQKNKLFKQFSKEFRNKLCQLFHEESFAPNEEILKANDAIEKKIYFVIKGKVELFHDFSSLPGIQKRNVQNRLISDGEVFGSEILLDPCQKKFFSARSVGVSRIAYFDYNEFLTALNEFEDDKVE